MIWNLRSAGIGQPKMRMAGLWAGALAAVLLVAVASQARSQAKLPPASPALATEETTPKDPLGRATPRGTVLGFLAAMHKNDFNLASEYLNTRLHGEAAATLARQLGVVLDRRLPAKLNLISDKPEGAKLDPQNLNQDLIGTVNSEDGGVPIVVERVDREGVGQIWLFSAETLRAVPQVFAEIDESSTVKFVPRFLTAKRFAGIPLFEWVFVLIGLPVLYLLTLVLNTALGMGVVQLRRKTGKKTEETRPEVLPRPVRFLLVSIAIRMGAAHLGLSLLARQFWVSTALLIGVVAVVWLLVVLNSRFERYANRRLYRMNLAGIASVLRLGRRAMDLVFVFAGVLVILHSFGVNVTPALAGLGVGGIAVALAAQKTLENVIGGVSLILDQVVRIGDTLKLGDTLGVVDEVGLRSTRIRTNDRTLVSVPNGQVATMNIENFSGRDKFWFHPLLGLVCETTSEQMQAILEQIRGLLLEHPLVEQSTVRVRFVAFGPSSLNVEVFSYFFARDWSHFLEIQEGLLLAIMAIVENAGSEIALPAQAVHVVRERKDREQGNEGTRE